MPEPILEPIPEPTPAPTPEPTPAPPAPEQPYLGEPRKNQPQVITIYEAQGYMKHEPRMTYTEYRRMKEARLELGPPPAVHRIVFAKFPDQVRVTKAEDDEYGEYGFETDYSVPEEYVETGYSQEEAYPEPETININEMPEKPMYAGRRDILADIEPSERQEQEGPGPDEDPEDWQAKKDLEEVAGIYGLKLGGVRDKKTGETRIAVAKKGFFGSWQEEFPDYISAMDWIKRNMHKVSRR
jgi:hypothetical protein